jgi:hypothetical protein
MDIAALARDLTDRYARADFASPPFPPYYRRWAECERARAVEAYGAGAGDPDPNPPAFVSFTEARRWRLGQLDAYLYRIEPTASALLLVLHGDVLAYVALAGGWFMYPPNERIADVPPSDLGMMAIWARVEGELDMLPGGAVVVGDAPVHVGFQIEPSRYAALGDEERDALHVRCIPAARDVALLFCGRSGPLLITLSSRERDDAHGADERRHALVTFEAP